MSELSFHIQIRRKGNCFVASAPEVDVISQGRTIEEARKNLLEVVQIQFEEMREMGTLEEYLAECGDDKRGILRASSEGVIHNLTRCASYVLAFEMTSDSQRGGCHEQIESPVLGLRDGVFLRLCDRQVGGFADC